MSKITIGKVLKPRGVKGELKIFPLTKDPSRFELLESVFIGDKEYEIEKVRFHNKFILLKLKEFNDRDSTEFLRDLEITINESELLDLEEDEYYIYQLIGCKVYDINTDSYLGELEEVLENPGNDVYIVVDPDKNTEVLLPATKEVIKNIDIENKIIKVNKIDGL